MERLVPGADFVLGVVRIRGAFVPVIDLSTLISGTPSPSARSRLVLLRVNDHSVALAVDDVLRVIDVSAESLHSMPPLLKEATHDRILGIAERDGQLLAVLQTARLVEGVSTAADERSAQP